MATISFRSKSLYYVRSVSLPSCPHPLIAEVNEHLSRLRSSQSTSSSLSSIANKLYVLEEMYDSFDDFLKLSNTQQVFVNTKTSVEEILDGYMWLLDLCANVKEISLDTKQDVQELLSVLRRRREANEIGKYLTSRKNVKRGIQKTLRNLKNIKLTHRKNGNEAFGSMFIDIEAVTVEVFESLMSYIAGSKSHSKLSGLAAKKYFVKSVSFKAEVSNSNEFEQVDDGVEFLITKKADKFENKMTFENLLQMTKMESSLQDLEEGLESLFRRLIKTRVTLLNILNN